MSAEGVAGTLGVSVWTVHSWRRRSQGPAYYKIGGSIRYLRRDVDAYHAACRREPAAS